MQSKKLSAKTRKLIIALVIALASVLIIPQFTEYNTKTPVSRDNYFMDTTCNISVYSTGTRHGLPVLSRRKANQAIDRAYERLQALDKTLSKTCEASDVYRLNHSSGEALKVSQDTLNVIKSGINYGLVSAGKFDITIGNLTALWDFHSEKGKIPDTKKLEAAIKNIDYRKIRIIDNKVAIGEPCNIDLGGIGKGYAADELAKTLKSQGVTSAVINLGGNIVTIGTKPHHKAFTIGIETPFSDHKEILGSVKANNQTVVTSGIYERKFELAGKIYHHILDVKTGFPADTDIISVTLIGPIGKSMDLDALSTICLLSGSKEAIKLIEAYEDIECLIVQESGEIITSSGFEFEEK